MAPRQRPTLLNNRRRPDGWLAPSLQHRVLTTLTWVKRLYRFCPITALSMELVKFDTQLMENAEISGIEYQQGTVAGYELREYMLEKWSRTCAYCGKTNVPLQIEHLIPRVRGGSNRVSNLTLSCGPCNQKKGHLTAEAFGFPHLMDKANVPLKDAAAVNTTRWALWRALSDLGCALEVGTGGRTKWNRTRLGWEKAHWCDAAAVGASTPEVLRSAVTSVLLIAATGHGNRQRCRTNKYGFPIRHVPRQKVWFGFRTGDLVRAAVPKGKYVGVHVGRVRIRKSGSFDIPTARSLVQGISYQHCRIVQRADGYAYAARNAINSSCLPGAPPQASMPGFPHYGLAVRARKVFI